MTIRMPGFLPICHYATIKPNDVANGSGVRVSLFISGCTHKCDGCFNEEAWNFNYGKEYTSETVDTILSYLDHPYIKGLSLLGGEPMHPWNQSYISRLIDTVKEHFPEKDIWCYSGYTFEELTDENRWDLPLRMLKKIDVLVDGKFEIDKKDLTLKFRGSSNQRIIDVQKSLELGSVILFDI